VTNDRTDARRHRQALLQAASAIFLEHGITAPLDLVVTRAGVGRATLYRHFPDRVALVLALVDQSLDALEALAKAIPHDRTTFQILLQDLADILAKDPSLADFWRVIPSDNAQRICQLKRFRLMFDRAVSDAIEGGTLRGDFRSDDMLLVGGMLGAVAREPDADKRRAMAARLVDLLVSGLQPVDAGTSR